MTTVLMYKGCRDATDAPQELHGARSDALGKHLDLVRAEKASLAAELAQARSECADMHAEIEHLHGRCAAAEASTDAISKVSSVTPAPAVRDHLVEHVWASHGMS